jgi:hypothetical protein
MHLFLKSDRKISKNLKKVGRARRFFLFFLSKCPFGGVFRAPGGFGFFAVRRAPASDARIAFSFFLFLAFAAAGNKLIPGF